MKQGKCAGVKASRWDTLTGTPAHPPTRSAAAPYIYAPICTHGGPVDVRKHSLAGRCSCLGQRKGTSLGRQPLRPAAHFYHTKGRNVTKTPHLAHLRFNASGTATLSTPVKAPPVIAARCNAQLGPKSSRVAKTQNLGVSRFAHTPSRQPELRIVDCGLSIVDSGRAFRPFRACLGGAA